MDYWNTIIAADPNSIYAQAKKNPNNEIDPSLRTVPDLTEWEDGANWFN